MTPVSETGTSVEVKLANCPFCGSSDVSPSSWDVKCSGCGAEMPGDTPRAITAWNRRAPIQPTPAETEPVASWDREHNIVSIAQVEGWEPLWPQAALEGMTARVRMELDAGAELAKKLDASEAQVSTLSRHLEEAREALKSMERFSQFMDGWGDEVLGLKQHPAGDYVKWSDILHTLRAMETVSHG